MVNTNNKVTEAFKEMIYALEVRASIEEDNWNISTPYNTDARDKGYKGLDIRDIFHSFMGKAYETMDCFDPKYRFLYERRIKWLNECKKAQELGLPKMLENLDFQGTAPIDAVNYIASKTCDFIYISQEIKSGDTVFIPKEIYQEYPHFFSYKVKYSGRDIYVTLGYKIMDYYILYLLANNVKVVFDMTAEEMLDSDIKFDKIFLTNANPININKIDLGRYFNHLDDDGTIIVNTFGERTPITKEHVEFTQNVVNNNYLKCVISDWRNVYWKLQRNSKNVTFFMSRGREKKDNTRFLETDFFWEVVSYDKIVKDAKFGYNVFAPKYVHAIDMSDCIPESNVYKITDIVNIEPRNCAMVTGDFILESGLTDNYLSCDLKPKDIELRSMEGYLVPDNCIVFSFVDGTFAKVKKTNGKVYAPKEYYCLTLKGDNLTFEDYFLRCLTSKFVTSQHSMYSKENYNIEDLWISLPVKGTQFEILSEERAEWGKKMEEENQKSFEEYKLDIRMKKHSLGQTLSDMNNWVNLLLKNKRNGILDDNQMIGKRNPISVGNVFDKIQNDIALLFEKVDSFTLGDGMVKEEFLIVPFIESFIAKHESPLFKYEFERSSEMKNYEVNFSKDALRIILENIISNAVSHGFDKSNEGNVVRIELIEKSYDAIAKEYCGKRTPYNPEGPFEDPSDYCFPRRYLSLAVSNNGKPLADGMTAEKIVSYGETTNTSHTGIGAFQIKGLWEKFTKNEKNTTPQDPFLEIALEYATTIIYPEHEEDEGKFEIISKPEEEFPVTYKFTFNGYSEHSDEDW